METLIATAFGRYVDVQRGEADQITQCAYNILRANNDGSQQSPDVMLTILCEPLVCVEGDNNTRVPLTFPANFPWIEPLLVHLLRRTHMATSVTLMKNTAISLIEARVKSTEPPKVSFTARTCYR